MRGQVDTKLHDADGLISGDLSTMITAEIHRVHLVDESLRVLNIEHSPVLDDVSIANRISNGS